MEEKEMQTKIELSEINKLTISVEKRKSTDRYAYYIYKDNEIFEEILNYTHKNVNVYWLMEPGTYKAKYLVRDINGSITEVFTEEVYFEGLKTVISSEKKETKGIHWIQNVFSVIQEIWNNRMRMVRLSFYNYGLANKDSYLGKLWNILSPLIQIGTFWFVFGLGIRNNAPVGEHAFLPWMLCGLIPWFFISQSITQGAVSIYSKSGTLLKLKYPTSSIPIEAILVGFYNHLVVLGILVIMLLAFGYYPNVYWLNIIYYFIYEFVFLASFAMITSVLTMIARDFHKLIASLIRLWFYLTPILWNIDNLPEWIQFILGLNPAFYIVNGFRDSLLYHNMFFIYPERIIFFWSFNIIFFIIGCNLQEKFKDKFIDML